jgi:MFS family permease
MFGIVAPVIPIWVGFTTEDPTLFYVMNFLAGLFAATALGAAAATTQDLVLPRMRGTATASFFLATTLVGLAIGPYMVGQISELSGSMRIGVLSLIGVAPISLVLLIYAYRTLPQAEATIAERARAAAGE